jgi:hypothetical protein
LFIEAGIRDTRLAFQIPIFFFDCSFSHSRFRRLLESKASQVGVNKNFVFFSRSEFSRDCHYSTKTDFETLNSHICFVCVFLKQNRIWWSVLSSFLFCLLKKGLLFGLTLEEQLLSIYQFLPSNQNSIEMVSPRNKFQSNLFVLILSLSLSLSLVVSLSFSQFFNELVADLIIRYHKTMKTAPNYNTLHFIKLLNFLLQATSISAQLREQIMTALNEQLQFVNKNTNQK